MFGVVGVGKSGAGFVFGEIAIEITIVGGEYEGRSAFHAQVLRGIGVARARVGTDAGEKFDIVAVHETDAACGVQLDELLNVVWIDSTMIAAGLPSVAGVIAKLVLLDPDICFRKKIDAAEMIPMGVADDDVSDFFGLETGELDGFVRANVIGGREIFEESIAMVATVEKDVTAAAADQPYDHSDFDFFVFRSAHDQAGDTILGGGVANGLDGIVGSCGAGQSRTGQNEKNGS